MAVSIRLRREGAKNRPYYKVVVADRRSPRDGKFIEIIGTYDPKKPGHNSTLKLDRAEYWISKGAQASDTVRSLIKKNKKQVTSASGPPARPAPAGTTPASPEPTVAETASAKPTRT
jgi:small subunit ribosomal protein S16